LRIWYDACTGKHVRYGAAIAKRLRNAGHEVIFTIRKHPDTVALARVVGENPIVIGEYRPESLSSRLEESANRVLKFAKMFRENPPDIAIAHQSVELCRTAFGLGIPIILTADTPHAKAVNKLTLPFASTLVVSEALPKSFLKKYCSDSEIIQFRGVDEVAWIKDLQHKKEASNFQKPLIVIRAMETQAAYALDKADPTVELVKKLEALGNVVFLERYNTHNARHFIDSASLVARADLVVSAGGTIAREAALQGVPTIIISEIGRTYVNTYLARMGFPIFMSKARKVLNLAKKHIGKKVDVSAKLAQFDNPVDMIEKAVIKLKAQKA